MRHADPSTPVPPHLSDEERALTVPTSGPRFDFLELIRDYASALLNHPGTKRHEATLQRVLDAHDALLTALSTEREAGDRDKARLDWLGDDGPSTPYLHRSHLDYWDGWVVIDPEQNEVLSSHGTDFRAAIDAARETFPDAMRAAPSTETPHA